VGAFFALTMIIEDDRIARRILRVILLSADEQPWLQSMVAESSKKLAIVCPKVGVVEDLRPNAFTIGYGRGATVVFSMGLLNLLSKEEVTAVALHELAHVKHNDFFFKTLTSALVAVSFFNPVAFISASAAQRQRELFADEGAVALLDHPSALSSALTKICSSLKNLSGVGLFDRSSVGLLFVSSVFFRSGILATHPRLPARLGNISRQKSGSARLSGRSILRAVMLSVVLFSFFIVSSYAVVELQRVYYDNSQGPVELVGHVIGGVAVGGEEFSAERIVNSQGGMFVGDQSGVGCVLRQGGSPYFEGFFDAPYIKYVGP
jgi:Zn-dependent protease with chaperone function